ncbi:MAG TPA: glycosyltransferase [Gemmataceae bacterium]|nr:glycosyltransferase [Gemmataceae bacterium]
MRCLLTVDPEIPVPPRLYGGIERVVAGLAEGLRERGHTVGLAAHPESTAAVDARFPWPGGRSGSLADAARNARTLLRAVRQFRPDVLHSFSRLLYLVPVLRSRLPKVMSYQREPTARTVRWANRLAGGTLRFTGCSEYICRLGRRAGGDWAAVPNFVDVGRYDFVPAVPADAPLVFLSRVEEIKGAHLAIAAARAAGRRLLIAGNHSADERGATYWRERVEPELGKGGVEYVGPVDDAQKNELLGRAAALLVPVQWDEPFGIVFAEALACGTPVISCPRGALPEIVSTGVNGYLARSPDELAEAVRRVGTIARRSCREVAERRFSRQAVTEEYERCYRSTPCPSTGAT